MYIVSQRPKVEESHVGFVQITHLPSNDPNPPFTGIAWWLELQYPIFWTGWFPGAMRERMCFQRSMFTLFVSLRLARVFFSLDEPPSQPRHVVDTYNLCAIVPFYRIFLTWRNLLHINGWLTIASASSSLLLDILCHFCELILFLGPIDPRFTAIP